MSSIQELTAEGQKAYSLKDFEKAVECFGEACGKYTQEHSREDPDLLFKYGRALFQLGMANSHVLGDKPKQEEPAKVEVTSGMIQLAENEEEQQDAEDEEQEQQEPEDQESQEEEPEDDEDDMQIAWQVLDLARTLVQQQLETAKDNKDLVARLADIHDLLGDISLEAENFGQAAQDLQTSLELREQCVESSSRLIAEAHFKLSLALEFDMDNTQGRTLAIKHTQCALDAVNDRVSKDPNGANQEDRDLIEELDSRIKELEQEEALAKQAKSAISELTGVSSTAKASTSGEGTTTTGFDENNKKRAATDLSQTLVRKKKRTD